MTYLLVSDVFCWSNRLGADRRSKANLSRLFSPRMASPTFPRFGSRDLGKSFDLASINDFKSSPVCMC